jgi:dephospho-CoA kinase
MPIEEKRKVANDEIDCSGTLEHTREQVAALAEKLKRLSARGRPGSEEIRK